MRVLDRYASAIDSSNLKSEPGTTFSDTDVLGAAGIAAKPVRTVNGVEVPESKYYVDAASKGAPCFPIVRIVIMCTKSQSAV